ncbi:hypothetical protein PMI10_03518 [Flavobacterium sp. CF136]|nr:hypothetical protein PMI10_03518 [Flavobacterium sp. CF136]
MANSNILFYPNNDNTLIPIIIIAGLFFILGLVAWANCVLIPCTKTINKK